MLTPYEKVAATYGNSNATSSVRSALDCVRERLDKGEIEDAKAIMDIFQGNTILSEEEYLKACDEMENGVTN